MSERHVVVVGAGAAGCALAARLSQDESVQVLLLEAGPDVRPDVVSTPARWLEAALGGAFDAGLSTVPQPGLGGRVLAVPRGQMLGGTTCINAMIHARPGPEDTAGWGDGWARQDIDRVLAATERHRGPAPGRGTRGPVPNGPPAPPNPLCEAFVQAGLSAGHSALEGSEDGTGVGWFDLSIDEQGLRADAAQSYLRPLGSRANLTVWPDTVVERLLLDDGRVTGLRLHRGHTVHEMDVLGEVVLSAGAVATPALLLRSGIGPADDLRAAGIEVHVDLPGVGGGLQDHPSVPVVWSAERPGEPPRHQFAESQLRVRSPVTSGRLLSIAFHHLAMFPPEVAASGAGATALVGLYEPTSRGRLTLDPAAPDGPPLIDPGYLSNAGDLDALVAGVGLTRAVAAQPALGDWGLEEVLPGPEARDPDALRDFARQALMSYGHPVGTCALGNGPAAVVDSSLRVRGTQNLRVADASVLPRIPSVAPSVTVQLIGWRAAELLTATRDRAPDPAMA